TDGGVIRLEGAVLQRVALDHRPLVERAVVADGDQRLFGNLAPVVEDPTADANAEQPPDQVPERRAGEERGGEELPETFVPPEVRLVDRAELRGKAAPVRGESLNEDCVADPDHEDEQ